MEAKNQHLSLGTEENQEPLSQYKNSYIFLDITVCGLLKIYRRFGVNCCLFHPKDEGNLVHRNMV
jgi:hypothetical protein